MYLYFTHFSLRISFSFSSNATRFFSSASSLEQEISEPRICEAFVSFKIFLLLLHEKLDDDELEEEDDELEDLSSC